MNFVELSPPHEDLIHDIAFDYYGKRFATCSSDKHIKIWTLDEDTGTWTAYDIARAHTNSVWRLSWANPEYGQLLASCSQDNSICLWEEQEPTTGYAEATAADRWRKFKISTCKRPVNDVKFCHRSFGLKIAAACADGFIRIYEATDYFDMNKWELCVEYQPETPLANDATEASDVLGLTCVSWNECPFEPSKLAVGGYSKRALVLSLNGNTLKEECSLGEHGKAVHDIAWAPAMGRSYHLIATASREVSFKIHKLHRKTDGTLELESTQSMENPSQSTIWRVSWNATGTVLATSAEDGTLSLWRRDFSGKWNLVQELSSGLQQQMMQFYQNP